MTYIPITDPNEIIQDGDEYSFDDETPREWYKFKNSVGIAYGNTWHYRDHRNVMSFRRPVTPPSNDVVSIPRAHFNLTFDRYRQEYKDHKKIDIILEQLLKDLLL